MRPSYDLFTRLGWLNLWLTWSEGKSFFFEDTIRERLRKRGLLPLK